MAFAQLVEAGGQLAERAQVRPEHRPRPALLGDRAAADRAGDRRLADRPRLGPPAEAHQRAAETGEHARSLDGGWLLRDDVDRPAMLSQGGLAVAAGPRQEAE